MNFALLQKNISFPIYGIEMRVKWACVCKQIWLFGKLSFTRWLVGLDNVPNSDSKYGFAEKRAGVKI